MVTQAPEASAPTITSGTTSTERSREEAEKAMAPRATGPVPGRTSGSVHQEAWTTARQAARSSSIRPAPSASSVRTRPQPTRPRP